MSTYTAPKTNARTMFRRVAAGATLAVAPMLIALGAAGAAHADAAPTPAGNGSVSAPAHQGTQRNQDIMRSHLPHTSLSHHMRRNYAY